MEFLGGFFIINNTKSLTICCLDFFKFNVVITGVITMIHADVFHYHYPSIFKDFLTFATLSKVQNTPFLVCLVIGAEGIRQKQIIKFTGKFVTSQPFSVLSDNAQV